MPAMLDYDFMRTAFAAAGVVAVVSGAVGYFLVLRGQTFAGHALAHVGFTGATGAFLVGVAPLWGLVLTTVAAGVGMGLMGERLAQRDVAIGLVLSLSLGLALLEAWLGVAVRIPAEPPAVMRALGAAEAQGGTITALSAGAYLLAALPRPAWTRQASPLLHPAPGATPRKG